MKPAALLARYQMALEVIALSKWTNEGTIARKALGAQVPVVQLLEPDPAAVAHFEMLPSSGEPEPGEETAHLRTHTEAGPINTTPAVEPEDEPEPIDLDEIDAELDEEERPPEPRPRRKSPEKPGRDGLTPTATRILEFVRDRREVRPGEVIDSLGLSRSTWQKNAQLLLDRGMVVASGERDQRVFRPAPQGAHREATEAGKQRAAQEEAMRVAGVVEKAKAPTPLDAELDESAKAEQARVRKNGLGTAEGRVLEAVTCRNGSIRDIAQRLQLPSEEVALAIRKLDREGEIRSRVENNQLVWGPR